MAVGTNLARYVVAIGPALCRPVAVLALLAIAPTAPAMAADPSPYAERHYDIAAQDLETALLAFSRVSGVDIVYDRAVLRGQRSALLRGSFAPPIAVATLLRESGLAHRFTSATAVLIQRPGSTERMGGHDAQARSGIQQLVLDRLRISTGRMIGKPRTDYRAFGEVVQSTIMRHLQDNPPVQARRFQARLAVQIDPQGVIRQLHVESGSGNPMLDEELTGLLNGMALPRTPPEGMPQPVWFEIVQR
ncbi:MAG TPA: TonB C-terminal domain-containing protein [Sphingobium sp.]|uniref:TonB C-terminal domain-containing protein n=1 Tax=Sphingobium sp. TaxID=1912891 RepID=UPI002ED187DF